MDGVRLLRGRVLIRQTQLDYGQELIAIPATYVDDPRNPGGRAQERGTVGRGVIVAHGPPALTKKGKRVEPEFRVGDEVLYVGEHHSRDIEFRGEKLHACAQEEIQAVIPK